MLSVNYSHIRIIYVKIFEKVSSGGFEVSFSIYTMYISHDVSLIRLVVSNVPCLPRGLRQGNT